VHTHAAFSARVAARLEKCKIVHTRHSVFPPSASAKSFPKKQIGGLINNFFSDIIIAVSPAAMENIVETGTNPERIAVIYNGVPPARTCSTAEKAEIREKYGIGSSAFVVVQLARLVDIKGQDYTLDAAKVLVAASQESASQEPASQGQLESKQENEQESPIIIVIAGDGDTAYEQHLHRRVKEESIKNVILTGFVSEAEELENIADIQINTSYGTEATSLALLEGMSLGIPTIASDFGGNPYVITHEQAGLIIPQKNGESLAEAILKLKNDQQLYNKLSEGAAADYNARFRDTTMARKIEEVYEKLAENLLN
jgi:glycosyltransferase involved in cell wall biosynthesis